jgi:hypothetical protein
MATQLFLIQSVPDFSRGEGDADLLGTTRNWVARSLSTSRGSGAISNTATSVTGPTVGIDMAGALEWISGPLDQDVTISGTISLNLWGLESSMNANAAIGVIIERLNSQGARVSTISQSIDDAELGTAAAVNTWTATPTSTNMLKGDRIRVRVYFDDAPATTMATGFTLTLVYAGTTAAASGDSYITFTENFGFLTTSGGALITQSTATSGSDVTGSTGTVEALAQGFNLTTSATVSAADLYVRKVNSPTDNLVLDLVSTVGGSSLATATVAASSLSTTAAFVSFTFSTPATLAAGNYFLQLTRSGARDTGNRCQWYNSGASDVYAGGEAWVRNSGSWSLLTTDPSRDFGFILYGGSTLYLTDTAAEVDPNGASYDAKEAWTSRGSGVVIKTTSAATGPTAPVLARVSPSGSFAEWFTKQLTGFTLSGLVACNIRADENATTANGAIRVEVAICASDGTSPVVWGSSNDGVELGTSEAAMTFSIAGDDTTVTDGQRLRIRVYFDDAPGVAMFSDGGLNQFNLRYAGTSGGASGDTFITLPQAVTEYVSFPSGPVTSILAALTQAVTATALGGPITSPLPALTQSVTAEGQQHFATVTSLLPAFTQSVTGANHGAAIVTSPLPSITTAVTVDVSAGGTTATVTSPLPVLTQILMVRHANTTDWSDPASDTTTEGAGTRVMVVTVGV